MSSGTKMAEKIRIGFVGCGIIAQGHIRDYMKIAGVEIVAFCDINRAAAEASAAVYGSGDVTSNMHDIFGRDDIDAVDVCLHNNFHSTATIAALESGKHVYCEKPMAGSYVDAVAMKAAAERTGKHLHIQLSTLYANETRAAKELIDGGHLGEVYHARSSGFRRRGRPYVDGYATPSFVQKKNASGGALYDMGVYHISQVLYLLGNPKPERITGKTYQRIAMDAKRQEISNYDVEEFAAGFIRLEGDRSMDLVESWAANLDNFEGSYLLGSTGGVRLSPFGYYANLGNLEFNSTANLGAASYRWENVDGLGRDYSSSQDHWIAALQGRVELLPTAAVGLNTMLISEGIYLSTKLGREVTAEEVLAASVSSAIPV